MKSAAFICAVSVMTAGCGNTSFNGEVAPRQPVSKPLPAAPTDITETFQTGQGAKTPVDMVWAIDNSGSMTDNIAKVRKNFDAFLASLSTSMDVKTILISASSPGSLHPNLTLDLPASAKNSVQIDYEVDSYNGPLLAALASCDAQSSDGVQTICGETLSQVMPDTGLLPLTIINSYSNLIKGKAVNEFRKGAARVYVFVTDDESDDISGDDFIRVMTKVNGGTAPRVFAFRGVGNTSDCRISNKGLEYDQMIAATGGQGYDICLDDWSPSFSQLTQSISSIATSSFTIKNAPAPGSVKVFLDGQLLTAADYTRTGTQIALTKKPDLAKSHEVKIVYQALPIKLALSSR